jgi:hypothetical protein
MRKIELIKEELKKRLPPEFLNRIDEIIIFKPLEKESLFKIVDNELQKVANKLKERNIELTWGDSVKELIIKHGYDPEMGARPLRRAIQKYVEDPIANAIIEDEVTDKIRLDYDLVNDKLIINGKPVNESASSRVQRIFHLFDGESKYGSNKKIMSFEAFSFAEPAPAPVPTRTPDTPTKPERPAKPVDPDADPIKRPSKDPNPIAEKKKRKTEEDVIKRYLAALKFNK